MSLSAELMPVYVTTHSGEKSCEWEEGRTTICHESSPCLLGALVVSNSISLRYVERPAARCQAATHNREFMQVTEFYNLKLRKYSSQRYIRELTNMRNFKSL